MRLFEFQAKRIFRREGIPVPEGMIATSGSEAKEISEKLGGSVVLKAQVLVGGRGLLGGVKFAESPGEAKILTEAILASEIAGEPVKRILVEKKVSTKHEFYLSFVIDEKEKTPFVIASSKGGVDIESVAERFPEKIVKMNVDILRGLSDFEGRSIAKKIGLNDALSQHFIKIIKILYHIFEKYDLQLAEINPISLTAENQFVAIDGRIIIDDRALFRHKDLAEEVQKEVLKPSLNSKIREMKAFKAGLSTYFELDGDIGIVADGAGTGMLTLDLVRDLGGEPASFCELGGVTSPNLIKNAMDIVLSNPGVKVLLMNFIGGLNRMDEMAEGIIGYLDEKRVSIPVIIRMTGTLEEVGREVLRKSGISTYDNIYDVVDKTVKLAGRN